MHTKDFGIIFDYNMKWLKHIEHEITKTKHLILIMRKIGKCMQTKSLRMIKYVFVHSNIN